MIEEQNTIITCDELKHICDMVVELTKIRAAGCSHLSVGNFAPDLMAKLLSELLMHKQGMVVHCGDGSPINIKT